jgi:hypothetical protein
VECSNHKLDDNREGNDPAQRQNKVGLLFHRRSLANGRRVEASPTNWSFAWSTSADRPANGQVTFSTLIQAHGLTSLEPNQILPDGRYQPSGQTSWTPILRSPGTPWKNDAVVVRDVDPAQRERSSGTSRSWCKERPGSKRHHHHQGSGRRKEAGGRARRRAFRHGTQVCTARNS